MGVDEVGVTSVLGRPYGSLERVEVADLLWSAACKAPPPQQQQQQQQQCSKCVCKGEDDQSNFDYEGTTFGLVGVLIVEVGLGAILIIFPRARNCVFAFLALVKIIRIARPIPESEPVAPQELVEPAAAVAPVRGNC